MTGRIERGGTAALTLLAPLGDNHPHSGSGGWQELFDQVRGTVPERVEVEVIEPGSADSSHAGFVLSAPDPTDLSTWIGSQSGSDVTRTLSSAGDRPLTIISQGAQVPQDLPVSYVVTYNVPASRRARFQDWQPKIIAAHLRASGFVSAEYHPPADDGTTWTVLVRFASDTDLTAWRNSPERTELIGQLQGIAENYDVRRTGLSWAGWFPEPQTADRPARWKQALATVVPLYPTVMLATIHLAPRIGDDGWGWPRWLVTFVVVSFAVSMLTWALMPLVTRALRPWLVPPYDQPQRASLTWTVAVVAALAALLAAFALTT